MIFDGSSELLPAGSGPVKLTQSFTSRSCVHADGCRSLRRVEEALAEAGPYAVLRNTPVVEQALDLIKG
jgi:hypothetical protein